MGKYEFTRAQESDRGAYDLEIVKVEVDCSGIITDSLVFCATRPRNSVYEFPKTPELDWQELIPDTVGEAVWTSTCELLPVLIED